MEKDYIKRTPLMEDPGADMDEQTPLLNSKTTPPGSRVENILLLSLTLNSH